MNWIAYGSQLVVVVLWAYLLISTFLRIRARAAAATGQASPGLGPTMAALGTWFREPAARSERRNLGTATAIVVGLALISIFMRG